VVNTAKVRIRMIELCYLSEQAVGLYREKESRYPLSLQQGEVAKLNACSDGERLHKQVSFDGRSVYTNNRYLSCAGYQPLHSVDKSDDVHIIVNG
jgi:hypothetical protein